MKTLCLHHNDPDGRAAGAIVRRALGSGVALYEMDYGVLVPWELIEDTQKVIVVDFSLPKDEMERIAAERELIWIDHHKTSLEENAKISQDWPGLRDTEEAGCVLTWQFFFPNQPVPKAVVLIGDRDIWRWAEADTGPFGEGLINQDTRPNNDELWVPLLNNDPEAIQELIESGKLLREARLVKMRRMVNGRGFPVTFEGFSTMVINDRGNGEMGEYIRSLGYQIAYCYIDKMLNGKLYTYVTLYSGRIDVSEIAKRFGGGGHPGASGFSFERHETPFPPKAKISNPS
jgi:oligoribonuclease NrnB/cAMP/cGMP phosphodiesterase (DHH superfamily)